MISAEKNILIKLLTLSQEKLGLLESLSQSLWELSNGLSKNDADALALHGQKQYGITNRIDIIDREFALLSESLENNISPLLNGDNGNKDEIPKALEQINYVLSAQRLALMRISSLNNEAIGKAQALASSFRERIVDLNRKNTSAGYSVANENQIGSQIDYKE